MNQKGDEWKPIGNNQSGFWRPVINISGQGSNEFSYLYRTTRPLVFQHEGEKWKWHRPGDPMPCDKHAKVEVLYADGKDCDGVLTANSLGWGLFFKPECRIIGWRYAETTKQVELGPEDVPPFCAIQCASIMANVLRVCSKGVWLTGESGRIYLVDWHELRDCWQINRSIPLTGKWDANAWEPCSKEVKA